MTPPTDGGGVDISSYLDALDEHGEALLHLAWSMATPSMGSVYYQLELSSGCLPGDRPWWSRWKQIRGAVDFRGRCVLELGSNMGLLSIFALLDGATAAVAADRDRTVLRAGQLAAAAFGVFPTFVHCNIGYSDGWERGLRRHPPDIVCMLNVLRWIDHPEPVFRFCADYPLVLAEDHGPFEVIEQRFRSIGFDDVRLSDHTELGRPLVVARRKAGPASP